MQVRIHYGPDAVEVYHKTNGPRGDVMKCEVRDDRAPSEEIVRVLTALGIDVETTIID